jgi:acylphosphatase
MKRLNIHVAGTVQGIGFRSHTKRKADDLGLTGAVANNLDGTVSIYAEGPEDKLQHFLKWTRTGPDTAEVTGHEHSWKEATGEYEEFLIIR